jgi:protein gp37
MSEGSLIGWLSQPGYVPWTLNVGIGCTSVFEIYAAAPGCLDRVIVGGEPARRADARPMHPIWARDLRDQTTRAGRAFYFKLLCTVWAAFGKSFAPYPVAEVGHA